MFPLYVKSPRHFNDVPVSFEILLLPWHDKPGPGPLQPPSRPLATFPFTAAGSGDPPCPACGPFSVPSVGNAVPSAAASRTPSANVTSCSSSSLVSLVRLLGRLYPALSPRPVKHFPLLSDFSLSLCLLDSRDWISTLYSSTRFQQWSLRGAQSSSGELRDPQPGLLALH